MSFAHVSCLPGDPRVLVRMPNAIGGWSYLMDETGTPADVSDRGRPQNQSDLERLALHFAKVSARFARMSEVAPR